MTTDHPILSGITFHPIPNDHPHPELRGRLSITVAFLPGQLKGLWDDGLEIFGPVNVTVARDGKLDTLLDALATWRAAYRTGTRETVRDAAYDTYSTDGCYP
jgi:hypothetical protein